MGICNYCLKGQIRVKELVTPYYTPKDKAVARKIVICFNLLLFRKKVNEMNKQTEEKLNKLFRFFKNSSQSKNDDVAYIERKFFEIMNGCKDSIEKYKLEKEIEAWDKLKEYKDLIFAKRELRDAYLQFLEKVHPVLFKTILEHLQKSDSKAEAVQNNLQILSENKSSAKLSLNYKKDNMVLSSNNVNKSKKLATAITNIGNTLLYNNQDREKISNELDKILSSYFKKAKFNPKFHREPSKFKPPSFFEDKNSILFKLIMEENPKERFPLMIKKFILKFLYLEIVRKSESIIDTENMYCKISKKEIHQILVEKNIDYLKRIKVFKNSQSVEINRNSQIIDDNEKNQKMSGFSNFRNAGYHSSATNVVTKRSVKLNKKLQFIMNNEENKSTELKKKEDAIQNPNLNNLNHLNQEAEIVFKNITKKKNGILLNSPNKKSDTSEEDYHFYNGELDKINFLYSGVGTLIKNNSKKQYLYNGTFRMGKKNGVGIFFKIINDYTFLYYRGEWGNNKMDGFGFSILIDLVNNKKIFRKGRFVNNKYEYGFQFIIDEKYSNPNPMLNQIADVLIEKYEGEFHNDVYNGTGRVIRKILKPSKFDKKKFDIDTEYEYCGNFVENLEQGNGTSSKIFLNQSYKYSYNGEFDKSKMHGFGKIEFDGDYFIKSYEGIFEHDKKFCKYGIVEFKSGDVYEGFFDSNNQKSNIGMYFHYDKGDKYLKKTENFFGEFLNDKKQGMGRFVSQKDYKLLVGRYLDGEKNGNFLLTCNNPLDDNSDIKISFLNNFSMNALHGRNASVASNYNYNNTNTNNNNNGNLSPRNSIFKAFPIKQSKMYYLFENDEIIDKSEKPFKD